MPIFECELCGGELDDSEYCGACDHYHDGECECEACINQKNEQ